MSAALAAGATYAEARWRRTRGRLIRSRDGAASEVSEVDRSGALLRCIVGGAWGVASVPTVLLSDPGALVGRAFATAKASALMAPERRVVLAPVEARRARSWMEVEHDPLREPLSIQVGMLLDLDATLKRTGACASRGALVTQRRDGWLVSSEGHRIEEQWSGCGIRFEAAACHEGRLYWRSFGPRHFSGGWERLYALFPRQFARPLAQEAMIVLNKPRALPEGPTDLMVSPEVMAVLLHETVGRSLNAEAILARRSPLNAEDWRGATFGDRLSVTADPRLDGALGTREFDDEGSPTAPWSLVEQGRVVDLITGRESAAALSVPCRGSARSATVHEAPQVTVPNMVMAPGETSHDGLVERLDNGLQLFGTRAWSLDASRRHLVLRCELARSVIKGEPAYFYADPVIRVDTQALWSRCRALGNSYTASTISVPEHRRGQVLPFGASHRVVEGVFEGVAVSAL